MSKHNLFIKKIKKFFLSTNDSIENYFHKIKLLNSKKRNELIKNNKVFIIISILVIFTVSYFLIPTIYDKNSIKFQIKKQIENKFDLKIEFNNKVTYALLPRPHFKSKKSNIFESGKNIATAENIKIFISIDKLFSFKNFQIQDVIIDKADFYIDKENFNFFNKLLKILPVENKIYLENSNVFFKSIDDEILFINKIYKSKFYYDFKKSINILSSKNEIFNIPYKLIVKEDNVNKKLKSIFTAKNVRLNIENDINYEEDSIKGLININLASKKTLLNYKIDQKTLFFNSLDSKNSYKGKIDLKPFYLVANFNYENLNLKNFFTDDSILIEIIKSEILNNKNLNMNLKFSINEILNLNDLNNLLLNINIVEGNVNFSNSSIKWKKDLKIIFKDSQLIYDKEQIYLTGKMFLEFKNIDNFYRSFQIPKSQRKKIESIQFDFVYNFNNKDINFDNVKINDTLNSVLEKFAEDTKLNEQDISNKVKLKNFVNDFFNAYAG